MSASVHRESATIYQFPVGGRAGATSRSADDRARREAAQVPAICFGSWYHEDAIKEDTGRKN
ncbi:DUF2735 domain-containing protein [Ancylobacter sp. WKF20]|uniref:DUF2735 domain-containing protein n=1 Tax=Ancylobacter sp. WKF20 TaxID=3039801 RepID=UPI0024343167|nr:DUF2735 domain-containing protein [Ancylobacter sp. WKF20]WGD29761.1 DUF2735 domain-containing protein [Ancylobacter sp. WKF20]